MDCLMGTLLQFAGNFQPEGWLLCNGQSLQTNQYPALYSILGTTYGGDGVHTFNLPNLNTHPIKSGPVWLICVDGIYPTRS
jgi:microcystin-dependent protein